MEAKIIKGYSPERLFAFFEEITKIPRGSGNEAGIAAWLENFARERGLYCVKDEVNNVFIKCPATKGYENEPAVLLQGHTDMVCEKNSDVDFDFEKDPLDIYIDDNGFLRARGTTLGADNGVAVAIMLSLLDGELSEHPALECLFTVEEETGLDGAKAFDYSLVGAKKMINLDSENDGEVIVGCAGGTFQRVSLSLDRVDFNGVALRISLGGLMGGHSGENINSGRANANKLLGRALLEIGTACPFNLVSISGGSKDNAIPREAEAIVAVSDAVHFEKVASDVIAKIRGELSDEDSSFFMRIEKADSAEKMATKASTDKICGFISSVQNGVIAMSTNIKGLVEFSRNLGIITTDGDTVNFIFSTRSAIDSQLDFAERELGSLASLLGGSMEKLGRYPGWEYARVSPLREKFFAVYRSLVGKDPESNVIHAGLECGIIKSHIPDMDIISIGPGMRDIHSPDEALDLASLERTWKVVCGLLK
ncbi:MAG: aminoacyl-histidine dipeptidase [Ruminococcaceae bacterium]|nr:aminoacyl-histidine dipeptidase [Oscillospiraceae bacterium]